MKQLLIIIFIFIYTTVADAQILKTTFDKVLANSCFRYANVSVLVVNISTGDTIYKKQHNSLLQPASTLKLLTTGAALEILGENYRFKTQIQYSGTIDSNGTLNGDIYIKGGGDPTLGSHYFTETDTDIFLQNWINAIKQANIRKINGKIIADASIYEWQMIPGKWAWEDIGNYYGAGASGLTIYDNRYTLHFKTGAYAGAPTKIIDITPKIPRLTIKNYVKTANIPSDQAYIYGAPYTYQRIVRGRLPRNKKDFKVKGSMPDPALFSAYLLYSALKNDGISVDTFSTIRLLNDTTLIYKKRKNLYTNYSVPLKQIVQITNTKSINLFAEHLLRELSLKTTGKADVENAPEALIDFWKSKGLNSSMQLYDGSGLSAYDALSASDLVFVLTYMFYSKHYETFYNSLPILGQTGTLKYYCRNKPAAGYIRAKTGTLRRTKAFAGYSNTENGQILAFAIIINKYNCSNRIVKKYFEQLLCALKN